MRLNELLRDVPVKTTHGNTDVEISAVVADSRLVTKGSLFAAIAGFQTNGARFVDQAVNKGAAAIVSEPGALQKPPGSKIAWIEVDDSRAALALIAANFYGRPARNLTLVGVTGTSGKTTTTKMIESIFDSTGEPVGLVGTIEYRAGSERLTADRTTPDAVTLQEWFRKMVDAGVKRAVMEVSSHALALKRTFGVHFAAAVFTNLSRDHFDFHKNFEDYFAAKRILFDQIDQTRKTAIVNSDDEYGRRIAAELVTAAVTFGRSDAADIRPYDDFDISIRGLHGRVRTPWGDVTIASELLGLPNLYNWLAAIGAALAIGVPVATVESGIRNLSTVRGRFERVSMDGGPTVIVDYAHKPDALEKLLGAVRDIARGQRIVLLFGCGGDRDKGKRPQMGEIAGRLADYTILTSDNPRSEEPEKILDDIEDGMRSVPPSKYARIVDRREAIATAVAAASAEDVVVIAGKGHESYQVAGDQISHFDDREEAELALKKRNEKAFPKKSSN